ncbi:hypothetical protein [Planomonospora sp. ID82291]|uniref:hypothetical protein n=1 Tax=Planomonospora sp. ID82291 TaxID=2738136 RepID=UPI0018C38985|nr:hypothetical protein [Planomonospora sp. ID82291]MBG0818742.1 hypothetical protein [Planomonospora sp. ID82291]
MPPKKLPKVDVAAGQRAVERIIERRQKCDDPDLERLEVIGDEQPVELLRYVLNHQRVPAWALVEDVVDGLWVLGYVRLHVPAIPSVLDDLEYDLVAMGYRLKVTNLAMASPLGLRTAQAVDERHKRERAARLGLPRLASAERDARLRPRQKRKSPEAAWYDRHAVSLWDSAERLTRYRRTHSHLIDEELAEDLAHLQQDVAAVNWPLDAANFSTMRSIGARVRLLLPELQQPQYSALRQELGALLPRLSSLATAHGTVLDDG